MKRALFPMCHAERAELLQACKADLPIVAPVWIATAGGAAMCTTPGRTVEDMWAELDAGAALFSACWNAPIDRVAIENPIMHRHARERLPADLPAPQIVQPWWFGDPAFKGTGFYRRGLPDLVPTHRLTPPAPGTDEHKAWSRIHRMPPGPDRWKERSRTFHGIAEAMADQWGGYAMEVAA